MRLIKFANILLLNRSGEVLVLRRTASHPTRPLALDLPGGCVEAGENFGEAVIRELQEETGIIIAPGAIVLVREHRQVDGDRDLHGAVYCARLDIDCPLIVLSDEHDTYKWISPIKLSGLPDFHQESINYARTNGFLL